MIRLIRSSKVLLFVVVLWLVVLPLIFVFYGAVHQTGTPTFAFTDRYLTKVFLTTSYALPLWNTLRLAFCVCLATTAIGLVLAWMMARTRVYWSLLWEIAIIVPIFISPFVGAIGWVTLGTPRAGLLNKVLQFFHLGEINIFTFWGTVFTMALYLAPYSYNLLREPLARLNPEYEEAAETCGAPAWRRMRLITFPMISPPLFSSILMMFVVAAEMFSIPGILAVPSGFPVLSYSIVELTVRWPVNYSEAAAVGLMLLIITVLGIVLYRRVVGIQERFVTVGPRSAKSTVRHSGVPWQLFATAVCFAYVALAVILPLVALVIRTLLPYYTGNFTIAQFSLSRFFDLAGDGLVRIAFVNSLLVMAVSTVALVALSFLIAVGKVRGRDPLSRLTELLATLPIAVPGLLFGVGLLWMYIGTPVYATMWIIVLVMLGRFLPLLVRIFETALIQIGRELDEAAAASGASEFKTMLAIRLPLLRGATRAATSVATTQSFNEINASVLLFTSGSAVVPVLTYNYAVDGDFSRASAIALVQVAVLTVGLILLTVISRRQGSRQRKAEADRDQSFVATPLARV
jgi:iron(III) transport system permease protein